MSQGWSEEICNDRAGFLFKHRCSNPVVQHCERCEKPICQDHAHSVADGLVCTACAKSGMSRSQNTGDAGNTGNQGYAGYDDSYYPHSPYFYSSYYYPGYGHVRPRSAHQHHDANDFTQADSEHLVDEGDGDFEYDMSES